MKWVGVNERSTMPFIDAEGCRNGEEIGRRKGTAEIGVAGVSARDLGKEDGRRR
jgi:hypothetical protein